MTSAFTRQADRIEWSTSTGPVSLPEDQAEGLLAIFCTVHDEMQREGLRAEARPLRGMILDLQDALQTPSPTLRAGHINQHEDGKAA